METLNLFERANSTYNFSSVPESKSNSWNKSWDLGGDGSHQNFYHWVDIVFQYKHPVIYSKIIRSLEAGDYYSSPIFFALRVFAEAGQPELDGYYEDIELERDDPEYTEWLRETGQDDIAPLDDDP